jgi:hypothetical protein
MVLSAPIKRQQHPCRPLIAASSQAGCLQLALRLSGSYLAMSLLLCIEKKRVEFSHYLGSGRLARIFAFWACLYV